MIKWTIYKHYLDPQGFCVFHVSDGECIHEFSTRKGAKKFIEYWSQFNNFGDLDDNR